MNTKFATQTKHTVLTCYDVSCFDDFVIDTLPYLVTKRRQFILRCLTLVASCLHWLAKHYLVKFLTGGRSEPFAWLQGWAEGISPGLPRTSEMAGWRLWTMVLQIINPVTFLVKLTLLRQPLLVHWDCYTSRSMYNGGCRPLIWRPSWHNY